jgi:hypothetical protein
MSAQVKKTTNPTNTVLTITVGFVIIFLVFQWKWALTVSLIVGIAGLISNTLSRYIDFVWMQLAKVLSYIVPNILLSAIFYLFLFPIALLSRLFGKKDPMLLKNRQTTAYKEVNKTFTAAALKNPW